MLSLGPFESALGLARLMEQEEVREAQEEGEKWQEEDFNGL